MLTEFNSAVKSKTLILREMSNILISSYMKLMETGLSKIIISTDKTLFHISGRQKCRLRGAEQPRKIAEYVSDTPILNVWCGLLRDRVIKFFFC
jgi:hypothetical protein